MKNLILFIFLLPLLLVSQNNNIKFMSPPGTIKLSDNFFIDVAPVDNIMYKEFLYKDSLASQELLQSRNKNLFVIITDSASSYFEDPKYIYFPVLKISKKEAINYCKWRTDMVNKYYKKRFNKRRIKVEYRLPTSDEFIKAIDKFGYSKKKLQRFPYFPMYTYRKKYRKKPKKAIFLKNNLSEYTIDSIPFGSNWKKETNFKAANNYTGFRCVCEIVQS